MFPILRNLAKLKELEFNLEKDLNELAFISKLPKNIIIEEIKKSGYTLEELKNFYLKYGKLLIKNNSNKKN
ncbi:MAG: hypothetical protein KGV59_06315 [Tenacibaculum sp.]|nr:hypothetical protein [Tenacibaculum sp.]